MRKRIRILLIGDDEFSGHGLQRMLELEEDMEVVDRCSPDKALSEVERLSPDVVLVDIRAPRRGGIEAARCLKRARPGCGDQTIIFADSTDCLVPALEAGMDGYVHKGVSRAQFTQTIRDVHLARAHAGSRGDTAELLIAPPADAGQIQRFVGEVESKLRTSVVRTVGSWGSGTTVTVLLKPDLALNLVQNLGDIAEVERVEESPLPSPRGGLFGFARQFRVRSEAGSTPKRKILVTLEQPVKMNTPRLAAAWN